MCFCLSEQLAGVHSTTLNTLPNGTFDLDEMESKIRYGYPKPLYTRSRLICLENTHNIMGGCVLPLTFLKEVCVRVYGWLGTVCLSCVTNFSYAYPVLTDICPCVYSGQNIPLQTTYGEIVSN